jgi:hypothetical protein
VRLLRRVVILSVLALAAAISLAQPAAAAAPWCGATATADRPATVGGRQVRLVYAISADGADASAQVVPELWADVERIDTWWRLNDPARTPRFDLTTFACGAQADVTFLRLGASSADLAPSSRRYERIAQEVVTAGGNTPAKYVVYYDGPVESERLCGQGGGDPSGIGFAIVYVRGCIGLPKDSTVAHELLHAMGATHTMSAAPNRCPDDTSHVCDSSGDVLYTYAQPAPLSAFVLDLNHDDYYGHSGSWSDAQDSRFLRRLDGQARISVAIQGPGTVASELPGISCPGVCSSEWDGDEPPTLVAEPRAGYKARWTGACNVVSTICTPPAGAEPKTVTAVFVPAAFRLAVAVAGRGRVTSPAGIACAARCAQPLESFEPVTLRAVPAKGWRFRAWGGACRGAKLTCRVPMTAAASVRATFVRRAK